eukprot:581320-Pyramimonas_sp.AAC.1
MAVAHLFFGKPVASSHFLVALSFSLFSSCATSEHAAFSRFPGLLRSPSAPAAPRPWGPGSCLLTAPTRGLPLGP